MEALTPASPDSLPPLGDLIADEPFWRYRAGAAGRALPTSAGGSPRILSPATWPVVTETGTASGITEPAENIWAALARRYGPSLVLPEHHPAPQTGERGQILDLVRAGADGSPHCTHVWPAPQQNPRHARLELWMAVHGYRIISRPANPFGWCGDEGGS